MYLVLTKADYGETWTLTEAEDVGQVMTRVLDAMKKGQEVKIAEERAYTVSVIISDKARELMNETKTLPIILGEPKKEEVDSETRPSESSEDTSPGSEGNGKVRRRSA